jgi:hypothetical protein
LAKINISGYEVLIDDENLVLVKTHKYHIENGMAKNSGLYYFARHLQIGGEKNGI